jgi:hypothetical protein
MKSVAGPDVGHLKDVAVIEVMIGFRVVAATCTARKRWSC